MNQRDVELLSSYLDGQLKPSDSARLEARLKSEPELVSLMDDLRGARNLLRRLPQRRAPRNFTLTRKMVGQNPPLPRAYPAFRFATALATLLFVFTFGLNFMAQQLAAPTGLGGGGGVDTFSQLAPATEAPAAAEAPLELSTELAPPLPTQQPPSEDAARTAETPTEKTFGVGNSAVRDQAGNGVSLVSSVWQIALAGIAVLGAFLMLLMRRLAANRWRQKD